MPENLDPIEGTRSMIPRHKTTGGLSRREIPRISGAAMLALSACSKSGSARMVHVATTAGVNLTMWELLRQQKFLEAFEVPADVVAMVCASASEPMRCFETPTRNAHRPYRQWQ